MQRCGQQHCKTIFLGLRGPAETSNMSAWLLGLRIRGGRAQAAGPCEQPGDGLPASSKSHLEPSSLAGMTSLVEALSPKP